MKRLIPPLLLLMVSSCISLDKAIQVATKSESHAEATQQALNDKHRLVVAENCSQLYPVAESEVIPGKEEVAEETVEDTPVTVPCKDSKGQSIKEVVCPPAKTTIRTVTRTDTIRVRDTAKEASLLLREERVKEELLREKKAHLLTMEERDKYKKQRNTLLYIVGIAVVLVVLAGLRRLRIV
ncbi:hypothetical protein C8N40_111142 [Pontibacter mucosus]|uniref:Uncharacterized protein n=1 Tax=Pontibacter mucosus TaxID=1649266 RepID=A0A2T5YD57_9BACT|nr:hypothetical protein [Pontibacter mucosus]PTX14477.1 hypothetical protein C8N40_111142 [Pontibacter mucosus]